jgi:hypothetical protein
MKKRQQKRFNKKVRTYALIAVLLVFSILCESLLIMPQDASAQGETSVFKDLNVNMPIYASVIYLHDKGIISGFPDSTVRTAQSLTRAQAAVLMTMAEKVTPQDGVSPSYRDVPPDHWAYGAVEAATRAGLFRGYPDGTFHPDSSITRAEAVTLLLNLSGKPLGGKEVAISDVGPGHWAYPQVTNAVDAGLVKLNAEKLFYPDSDIRRGEMARGLSTMYTLSPRLRDAVLTGKLAVRKGRATIGSGEGAREVTGETRVGAGDVITTAGESQAEIIFDDGSGILIDTDTRIKITRSKGFNYMRQDGTAGVAVEKLNVKLDYGRLFGGLASSVYKGLEQDSGTMKTARTRRPSEFPLLLASTEMPPWLGGILLAEGETYYDEFTGGNTGVEWWAEPYTEQERVIVDMPWGVAGVRGTFWMCQADSREKNIISVATGSVDVRAGGSTSRIDAGQYTEILYAGAIPSAPAAMTMELQQLWAEIGSWVRERLNEICINLPLPYAPVVLPPEEPVEQPPVLLGFNQAEVNYINDMNIFTQITENVTAAVPSAPSAVTMGGGGGGGGGSIDTAPPLVVSSPGNISVNDNITFVFGEKIKPGINFDRITLSDTSGNPVDIQCTINGKNLVILPLNGLAPGQAFTVFIPAGAVQDVSGLLLASDYSFSFSTSPASGSSVEIIGRVKIIR